MQNFENIKQYAVLMRICGPASMKQIAYKGNQAILLIRPGHILTQLHKELCQKCLLGGFPGGAVVENLPANAGDTGSSPGLGRSHMPRSN